jgi:hypothetical protein
MTRLRNKRVVPAHSPLYRIDIAALRLYLHGRSTVSG